MERKKSFKGFSEETFKFLRDLKTHNNKEWFDQHKQDYQRFLLEPLNGLVMDVGDFMLTLDPHFDIRPAVNKTISRINRDTRFSKNKSPYKTTMWITFKRPNKNWKDAPAYFFEISPNSYRFGMGLYSASPDTMSQFREAIDSNQKKFTKAISFYSKQKLFVVEGEMYKRIFDRHKPMEVQEWYQRKNLYLVCNRKIDKILLGNRLIDDLISGFKILAPFYHYLWDIRSRGS